jgi:alkylation response protein AidB-like acyl-CoA dehydrogenase
MAKISGSELRYRMTTLAMDVVGRDAAGFDPDAMSSTDVSRLQMNYLMSPILRFGGGTNEVQRSIIASRHLGMAR